MDEIIAWGLIAVGMYRAVKVLARPRSYYGEQRYGIPRRVTR